VYLAAHIRIYGDVITASRNLSRGTTIGPGDISSSRMELSKLRYGYFTKSDKVIGKVVKRSIRLGESISPQRIKEPLLVHRGEEITIEAVTGALKVRVKGKALQDGIKGALISVRNLRSKRIIQAVAVEAGTVSVRM
jgi:flagella basal body P-ring formation protein FlgA